MEQIMKRILSLTAIVVSFAIALFVLSTPLSSAPYFYVATDRAFVNETPYINLEGPGDTYNVRVYRVADPVAFMKKSVSDRLVREKAAAAVANPIAITRNTWNAFKFDFRQIAREELNPQTRSHLAKAANVTYNYTALEVAAPGLLSEHSFEYSFTLPGDGNEWSYRRIPVPVEKEGLYLIECVTGSHIGYTVIVKTNLSFVVKQSEQTSVLFAANTMSGKGERGANVIMLGSDGAEIAKGSTDKEGIFTWKGKTPQKSLFVVTSGDQIALSDPDYFARSFYGLEGYRAYIYTDRPVYRPGDLLFFKGVVRRYAKNEYSAAGGSGQLSIADSEGTITPLQNIQIAPDGTFNGSLTLPEGEIPLGTWNIILAANGSQFSSEFAVDAYKKPTFMVTLTAPQQIYTGNEQISFNISARRFTGEPVSNASADCKVFRKKKYDFSPVGRIPFFVVDPSYLGLDATESRKELVYDGAVSLDENGTALLEVIPENVTDDYTYSAIVTVNAEQSSVSGSAAVSLNRSRFFIRLEREESFYSPGEKAKVTARLVPYKDDESVSDVKIEWELFERSFQNISEEKQRKRVAQGSARTGEDGSALISWRSPRSGQYQLTVKAKDSTRSETAASVTSWSSKKRDSIVFPQKNLIIQPKKDVWSAGEQADVLISGPVSGGTLFLTLESADVIAHKAVRLDGNAFRYQFRISDEMKPNCTLAATVFSGGETYTGEAKIVVPPVNKFIQVSLSPDKPVYAPGDRVELAIVTKIQDKPVDADVSISVVDEAIYQIQPDRTPPIATFFYHPRRNNVNTTLSGMYRFFGYSEEQRLELALSRFTALPLATMKEDRARDTFKDTCFWKASIRTAASGSAKSQFVLADNLTSWRVNAMAVTKNSEVGQAQINFIARKQLMVDAITPRFMYEDSLQTIGASVTNLTSEKITAELTFSSSEAITGKRSLTVDLAAGETKPILTQIKAGKAGARFSAKVTAGALHDSFTRELPILPWGVSRSETKNCLIDGNTAAVQFALPANAKAAKVSITLASGLDAGLAGSLEYLADYPYGCIEQTMSRFMPLMAVEKSAIVPEQIKERLGDMVSRGLYLIKSHQREDGGFGWFTEEKADPLMSAYVFWGLTNAKKYTDIDMSVYEQLSAWLYRYIERENPPVFERAYVLRALAEAAPVRSMSEKLKSERGSMTPYAKALTTLVLLSAGDQAAAKSFYDESLKAVDFNTLSSIEYSEWQNDTVECVAALLSAAVRMQLENDVDNLSLELLKSRNGPVWKSTRDTSAALIALAEASVYKNKQYAPVGTKVLLNNAPIATEEQSSIYQRSGKAIEIDASALQQSNTVTFEKSAADRVVASVMISYYDQSKNTNAAPRGVELSRTFYKLSANGNELAPVKSELFARGDLVMADLTLKIADYRNAYILLEDQLPAGFSVVRTEEYYSSSLKKEFDRAYHYDAKSVFLLAPASEEIHVRYFLHADLPGSYDVPPARASFMYYPGTGGTSAYNALEVK